MAGAGRGRSGPLERLSRVRWVRAVLMSPVIARPGYWFATACGLVWGGVLGGFRVSRRGGTTIGAVYLTSTNTQDPVLEHEAVHCAQWKRYGLAFIPLYLMAGQDARHNRFEVEAGLEKGGYV